MICLWFFNMGMGDYFFILFYSVNKLVMGELRSFLFGELKFL